MSKRTWAVSACLIQALYIGSAWAAREKDSSRATRDAGALTGARAEGLAPHAPLTDAVPDLAIPTQELSAEAAPLSIKPEPLYVHTPVVELLAGYAKEHAAAQKAGPAQADPNRRIFDSAAPAAADPALVDGLAAEFRDALLAYHRIDGHDDHSGLKGVQFPPIDRVKDGDVEGLKAFINEFSTFLAQQLGGAVDYRPIPQGGDRDAFRKAVAKDAAPEIKENALGEFMAAAESLQIPKIKSFVKRALQKAQKKFFTVASSSTGKHHPADEINYHGLLVHSIRNVVMARMIGKFLGLEPHEQEIADASEIIHDIDKGGIPWATDINGSGYAPDHGPIAAKWLKTFKKDCGADCDEIIDAVDAHMAQWNKPKPSPPKTLMEQIVSWADYLASLDNVYLRWRLRQKP